MIRSPLKALAALLTACSLPVAAWSAPIEVTVMNFVRAETDNYMARYAAQFRIGNLGHIRMPVSISEQDVIRMNRDTIYSGGVFDLTHPVTISLPDAGGRYQSLQVVDQDHYTETFEEPGSYTFTQEDIGTRYMVVIIRTFMDPADANDIAIANRAQDLITVEQSGPGELDLPDWDQESLGTVRGMLLALGMTSPEFLLRAFGAREDVDPVAHMLGTAAGWGGNPPEAALYPGGAPDGNDGVVPHALTVGDVPVDGFWSITVYNNDGFMERNELDTYSYNGVTAGKNPDGSTTVHFGSCEDGRINCIPITDGWNYVVRLYRPHQEILDGSWEFPTPEPVE